MLKMDITKEDFKDNWYLMSGGALLPYFIAHLATAGMQNRNVAMIIKVCALIVGGMVSAKMIEDNKQAKSLEVKNATGGDIDVMELGCKGRNVESVQNALNHLLEDEVIENIGTYDATTKQVVNSVFKGTSGLVDTDKGSLDKVLASDFVAIVDNVLNMEG